MITTYIAGYFLFGAALVWFNGMDAATATVLAFLWPVAAPLQFVDFIREVNL